MDEMSVALAAMYLGGVAGVALAWWWLREPKPRRVTVVEAARMVQ